MADGLVGNAVNAYQRKRQRGNREGDKQPGSKSFGRHGISGRKSSVLARAAFEITAHHLLRAAITGEVDYLDGVAENVIVGQPVTLGTGAVNLVYRPPGVKKERVAS